ncbi:hypothetical protein JCM17380_46090 [Desulfosporosinus burensis]
MRAFSGRPISVVLIPSAQGTFSQQRNVHTALEKAGFSEVQGIMLKGIKDKHGNKDWYVIKGKKL